jgi:hypothetical protein
MAANRVGIAGDVESEDGCPAAGRNHQRRKNSEKGGFAAAVGAKESE